MLNFTCKLTELNGIQVRVYFRYKSPSIFILAVFPVEVKEPIDMDNLKSQLSEIELKDLEILCWRELETRVTGIPRR